MDCSGSPGERDSKDSWKSYIINKIRGNGYTIAPVLAEAYEYKMNHPKRGKALIFNHKTFAPALDLGPRNGTDVDKQNLEMTFKYLGFDVYSFDDLPFKKILSKLKEISSEDHSDNDCISITVLTHGTANCLYAYDEGYNPEVLTQNFTADICKTLAGKPKLFFILACRGFEFDSGTTLHIKKRRYVFDGDHDNTAEFYKIPNQADFLTVFSTFPGFYSWRNSKSGSCFIQSLCRVFAQHHEYMDVLTMMTLVNREVAIKYESSVPKDLSQHQKKQMPQVCHTLLRQMYFVSKRTSNNGQIGTLV